MGMFDYIDFTYKCPKCGNLLDDFQSKSGDCWGGKLKFFEVDNFYTSCDKCGTWVEFNLKRPKYKIEDYEMTYREKEDL